MGKIALLRGICEDNLVFDHGSALLAGPRDPLVRVPMKRCTHACEASGLPLGMHPLTPLYLVGAGIPFMLSVSIYNESMRPLQVQVSRCLEKS